jgi:uncharacterized protein YggU (UPF0235/DUF167 family)
LVFLRVTPNARIDRIEGAERRDDGTAVLRVRVRALPDRGRANAAVVSLVAGALGVPKSSVALVGGETARLKTLRVSGEPARLVTALEALAV